jgi:hypothetical protein
MRVSSRAGPGKNLIQLLQSNRQRRSKTLFFQLHHLPDEIAMRLQFRKGLTHLIDDEVGYFMKEQSIETQRMPALDKSPGA